MPGNPEEEDAVMSWSTLSSLERYPEMGLRRGNVHEDVSSPHLPSATMHHALQAVSQEIQPQDERGDRQAREQRHPRKHLCHSPGFIDHAAPIRSGRRQAKAEEAEHSYRDGHIAKAQTRIDDEWPPGIRQNLDQHDV